MRTRVSSIWAVALALSGAACTMNQSEAPALTGPSDFAKSLSVTATPDTIALGGFGTPFGQSSRIEVKLLDESGRGVGRQDIRLEIFVGSTLQDCGTLTSHIITTVSDGTAAALFFAPGTPLPQSCSGYTPGNDITIQATPVGTNFQTSISRRATIRMVPQGVILPPPGTPTPKFTISPTPVKANTPVTFDASASMPGANATQLTYSWNFGDGSTGSGVRDDHDFGTTGTFSVTLTVTNERGISAAITQSVVVVAATGGDSATIATFTFSPLTPSALQPVFFNASGSSATTGNTLTTYAWNFGDGTLLTGSTFSATHTFAAAGTFTVSLTVTDNSGKTGTVATPVTVAAAGAGSLTADFSISPTDPRSGQLVSFNANLSLPVASITSYDWDFGDGTVVNGQTGFLIDHTYFTPTGNTYNIRLTVHDNTGRVATAVKSLTILAGTDPTASFTISQSPTSVGTLITFDGAQSTASGAKTIVRYTWNFGDGSAIVSTVSPVTTTTHSYAATGTYTIRLTVIDSAGLSGATTRTLLVQ